MSKIAKFSHPRIKYRVDLRHYLTDPYQIWWTYRLIMFQLDARFSEIWGFLPLIFVRGHFYVIGIASLLFRVIPRRGKVSKMSVLQTSEKVSWGKKKKKHAQNIRSTVHRTGDLTKFRSTDNMEISSWPLLWRHFTLCTASAMPTHDRNAIRLVW